MTRSRLRLLEAIQDVQTRFIDGEPRSVVFASILEHAVELTSSAYGLLGELQHTDAGEPYLCVLAATDRSWSEAARAAHAREIEEGCSLAASDAFYGEILRTGEPVLSNGPPQAQSGLPGAPQLRSIFGTPLYYRDELVGVLLVANGSKAYRPEIVEEFEPFAEASARVLIASRVAHDRRDAEAALRESESRFRQLAENIHEVFWLTDLATGSVIYVSPAYATIWGRTVEDIYADPRNWIEGIHPDDREEVAASFEKIAEFGGFDEEYRVVRPDGSIRWIHDRGFPFQSGLGDLERAAGIAEDITERKRMEATLRKTEERLRHSQRIEALGRVAGGVAHDFNNLLTVINGNTDVLLANEDIELQRRLLQQIAQAGGRAAGLTRQLLAFSRKQVLELSLIDMRQLFANLRDLLPPILGRVLELEFEASAEPHFVKADMHQLVQVVMNLAVNARDAMPLRGKLRITSRPGSDLNGDFVELTVSDSGVGIPDDVLPYIFDPFFTTKEEGKGSGLGLSMAFGIVTQLGGEVEVDTKVGRGSTFRIRLPAAEPSEEVVELPKQGTRLPARSLTILLVDDEPLVRAFTALSLKDNGHTILEAESGDAALEMVKGREDEIDLLITDVVMPGTSGCEAARRLSAANPDLAVLYISGYTAEYAAEFGVTEGGRNFLPKPFLVDDLVRKIQEIVGEPAG